jgi:Family of unknown function (DUF6188)
LVAGDLAPLAALRETPRDELVRVARAARGLVVTVAAVSNVLEARRDGTAVVADTWRWAKLLLHATHPYIGPATARDSDSAGAQEALEAWMADHAPEFQLTYEDGHDRAIALALGALYRDRGDEPQLLLDDERIDALERALQAPDLPPAYVEAGDGFEIGVLAGGRVAEVTTRRDDLRLRIATRRGEYTIDATPGDRSNSIARGAVVQRCVAHGSGLLEIDFEGGERLVAMPDPQYESWHVSGPEITLFSMPGGDFSYFDDDPRTSFNINDYDE